QAADQRINRSGALRGSCDCVTRRVVAYGVVLLRALALARHCVGVLLTHGVARRILPVRYQLVVIRQRAAAQDDVAEAVPEGVVGLDTLAVRSRRVEPVRRIVNA